MNPGIFSDRFFKNTIIVLWASILIFHITGSVTGQEDLQDAVDDLRTDVSNLQFQLSQISPARINGIEARLNKSITDDAARFRALENRMSSAEGQLGIVEAAIGIIENQIINLQNDVGKLTTRVTKLEKTSGGLVSEVTRLDNANKIWKNNFRIVNNTFTALKKKITFTVPRLRV